MRLVKLVLICVALFWASWSNAQTEMKLRCSDNFTVTLSGYRYSTVVFKSINTDGFSVYARQDSLELGDDVVTVNTGGNFIRIYPDTGIVRIYKKRDFYAGHSDWQCRKVN